MSYGQPSQRDAEAAQSSRRAQHEADGLWDRAQRAEARVAELTERVAKLEARDRLAADVLVKIEERALEDVADKAGAEDAEEKSYLTGRVRGLRLAAGLLKDAFPGDTPK